MSRFKDIINLFRKVNKAINIPPRLGYRVSVKVYINDAYEVKKKTRKRRKNKTVEYIHVNYISPEINRGLATAYFNNKGFVLFQDDGYCLTFYGGVDVVDKDIRFNGIGVSTYIERIYE